MFEMEIEKAFFDTVKYGITLFAIIDPLSAVPIFLGTVKQHKTLNVRRVINVCAMAVITTLMISMFFGQSILNFFGISTASFTIAGGMLLFSMAVSMISAHNSESKINQEELSGMEKDKEKELGIIPLAIPLLSGPGAISTAIINARKFDHAYQWAGAVLVILLIGLSVKIVFTYAQSIGNKIGQVGLNVATRIFGLILLSISIEMIVSGIKEMMPVLKAVW